MSISVRKVEFVSQGALWQPKDLAFFQKIDAFCKAFINEPPTLAFYVSCWAVTVNEEVVGVLGLRNVVDVNIRVKPHPDAFQAMRKLIQRASDYLEDQGLRGQEIMVYKSALETADRACPNWEKFLKMYDARPADRFTVVVGEQKANGTEGAH